jgi:hypothetical protein
MHITLFAHNTKLSTGCLLAGRFGICLKFILHFMLWKLIIDTQVFRLVCVRLEPDSKELKSKCPGRLKLQRPDPVDTTELHEVHANCK